MVHLFNHALIKGGLFLVAACIAYRLHSTRLADMAGLGRRMPWTSAALVIGGLGLVGVPATAGFVSKWYLVMATLEAGLFGISILVLLSSLLAFVYVWRVMEIVFFGEAPADAPHGDPPAHILIPAWILMIATLYFGLVTDFSAGVAVEAARELMGARS